MSCKLLIGLGVIFIGIAGFRAGRNLAGKWIEKKIRLLYAEYYGIVPMALLQCILFELWVMYSGNVVQMPVKVFALLLSVFSMKDLPDKIDYLIKKSENRKFRVLFFLTVFYSAFTVMGSEGIIYPLNLTLLSKRFFVIIVGCFWFTPVMVTFIKWYDEFNSTDNGTDRKKYLIFLGCCALILSIMPLVTLLAFNPGIVSKDTVTCLATYAHHIIGMPDWHPPFYVLCLKGIISIWDSTYAVVAVQIIFWIFVILQMLAFLYKQGISDKMLLLAVCCMSTSIPNAMYLCSIWKDIPYGISLLWLTVILARIVMGDGKGVTIYVQFILAAIFVCLFRQNGVVPYLAVIVSTGILLRKNKKVLLSIIVSLCLMIFIRGPVYMTLRVTEPDHKAGGKYIGLSQELLGTYFSNGDVSENTMSMINVLSGYQNGRDMFNPYWANASYDLDVPITEFIISYVDTFIRNPGMVIREILCRNDCIWHVFAARNSMVNLVNYQGEAWGEEWLQYYPNRVNNRFTGLVGSNAQFSADSQLYSIIFWRSGLHIIVLIWCILSYVADGKKKEWLIFIPLIGQIVSLMLSTGWSDFRYYWPINIMVVFLIMLIPRLKEC